MREEKQKILHSEPAPIFVPHLQALISHYDAFVIDIWGVVHNGITVFPAALDCLKALHAQGKQVFLLSNAPRRIDIAAHRLTEMGLPRTLYTHIYTSGEDCYLRLKNRDVQFYESLGTRLFHIGPERDRSIFMDLPYTPVTDLAEADFILNTGTCSFDDTLEDYEETLQAALAQNLPMICANPDKVANYGDRLIVCSGTIAERYEQLGGQVHYHGKPFPDFYRRFLGMHLPITSNNKILVIGDSLSTDIKGANKAGLDALLILHGIHRQQCAEPVAQNLEHLCQTVEIFPKYYSEVLAF